MIRYVGADLMGKDHESLPAFYLIIDGFARCVLGNQRAGAGQAVMEEIMVSGSRAEGVGGIALLPSELVQTEIDKIFTGKNREDHFTHTFLRSGAICAAHLWTLVRVTSIFSLKRLR